MEYRALIIDDNAVNTAVISGLLEKFHVKSVLVSSGEETVKREDLDTFHIIFTDYLMPGMNGIQVGKRVHELTKHKGVHIPVILCTANVGAAGQVEDVEDCIQYILKKPVKQQELEEVLRRYVDKDIKMEACSGKDEESEKLQIPGLDTEQGIRQAGDRKIYLSILKEFHRIIPKTCEKIRKYEESNDTENYRVEVHGLKGASRLAGAMELANLCEFLETQTKSRNPKELHSQTEYMLKLYSRYDELLAPIVQETPVVQERKEVSKDVIKEKLEKMQNQLDDYEIEKAEELFKELQGYTLDNNYDQVLEKLKECIESIDYEGGMKCIREYLSE